MQSPNASKNQQQQTGLDHLVEAATALTQLVRTPSVSRVDHLNKSSHQISDDEDARSKSTPSASITPPNANTGNSNSLISSSRSSSSSNINSNINLETMHANASFNSSVVSVAGSSTSSTSSTSAPTPFKQTAENAKEIFPRRLFRILSDPSICDIITWLPHGRAFVILKTDELAETVLPKYFPESCATAQSASKSSKSQTCKYPSFTRKLNRWGFRQVTRGPDSGAFHHNFFNREEPDLCLKMVCQRSKRRKGEKSMNMKNTALKPAASQILGPYSAALRQPIDSRGKECTKNPIAATTDCDSDSSLNTTNNVVLKPMSTPNSYRKSEDQATIVSTRSCNTPPPVITQFNSSSIRSMISPTISAPTASQASEMLRTVSTASSLAPSSTTNLPFSLFTNTHSAAQLDPRLILQRNLAASTYCATAGTQGTMNRTFPQINQRPVMPNFITFLDKTVNQQQAQPNGQSDKVPARQNVNAQQLFAPPVLTVPIPPTAPTPAAPAAPTTTPNNSMAVSVNNSTSSTQNQQQQSQQQTEAQLRVANARNMLYTAFLQALG
jgi:hypothetical protein